MLSLMLTLTLSADPQAVTLDFETGTLKDWTADGRRLQGPADQRRHRRGPPQAT